MDLAEDGLDKIRLVMGTALGMSHPESALTEARSQHCSSSARACLREAGAIKTGNPAAFVARWFAAGTPLGITEDMPDMSSIWEVKQDDGKTLEPDDLDLDATMAEEPKDDGDNE